MTVEQLRVIFSSGDKEAEIIGVLSQIIKLQRRRPEMDVEVYGDGALDSDLPRLPSPVVVFTRDGKRTHEYGFTAAKLFIDDLINQ